MTDDTSTSSAGRAAARGTAYGFILRIISFTLSQLTFRFVDPIALGRASIRLELLLNTALFIGREGFRLALIRTDSDSPGAKSKSSQGEENSKSRNTNNVSWLSVPVGGILSLIAFLVHLYSCQRMESSINADPSGQQSLLDYKVAGILYCIAAFVESIAEPLIIKAMQQLDVETRAASEGTATLSKAAISVLLLSGSNYSFVPPSIAKKWPVSAFGMAQLTHAIVLTFVVYKRKWNFITWPSFEVVSRKNFDIPTLKLVFIFTLQGIFKHLLTEGDRIVLTALANGYDQGVYAMASSYGGMASRLLLQPLEENARLLFSKQEKKHAAQKHSKDNELETTLCVLLKLVLYIGLSFSCVASNYTSVLLTILAGTRWGNNPEATQALSAFCIYTALLALNGTTEAFVYGVAKSGSDVGSLGLAHAFVGTVFALTSPIFVRYWGTVGLVAANGLGMVLRSLYSIHYASVFFQKYDKNFDSEGARKAKLDVALGLSKQFLPHPFVLISFLSTFIITLASQGMMQAEIDQKRDIMKGFTKLWLLSALRHVSIGLFCVLVIAFTAMKYETDFKQNMRLILREKRE